MTRSQSRQVKLRKQFLAMTSKGFVKIGRTWIKQYSLRHKTHLNEQAKKAAKWAAFR